MPKTMTDDIQKSFADRLAEYVQEEGLRRAVIIFHGGEPLLAGADVITEFADRLRASVGSEVALDFALQTNGILLTDAVLDQLEQADISVSLSLDGPKAANDLHRTSRKGRSSFESVMGGYHRLVSRPSIFAGIIAVIDPRISPEELFQFFDELAPPKLDLLLPDAHHLRPPPGRAQNPTLYRDWLIRAFDLWFDRYPHLPLRTFEALLDVAAGLPSATDAFGFGDVNLLSIETDGSYHDLDVLKIVADGASDLKGSVRDMAISAAAASSGIERHRNLLRKDGLSETCLSCTVVDICGGGSVPHRYGQDGFNNPSIYCGELSSLITHVKGRLLEDISSEVEDLENRLPAHFDLEAFERSETGSDTLDVLLADADRAYTVNLADVMSYLKKDGQSELVDRLSTLDETSFNQLAHRPGVVAWTRAILAQRDGRQIHDVDGKPLIADASYLANVLSGVDSDSRGWEVGNADAWLRLPFGEQIVFERDNVAESAKAVVAEALAIVQRWRPSLVQEMLRACQSVQFVRDPTAHPDKIVSFSDDTVPGALFVSVMQGDGLIDPYDLADSLIHEHRHQKLYLLERMAPTVSRFAPRVVSPWRADLRPPSGLLHAVFVFVELQRFWSHVLEAGPVHMKERATNQLRDTERNLELGLKTLEGCELTPLGRALANLLDSVRAKPRLAA